MVNARNRASWHGPVAPVSRPAFDEASEDHGLIFAAHAAVALVGAQRESQLLQALLSRDLIGQAKGILMERYKITDEKAFLFLARLSQDTNTKLHDIAEKIINTVQDSAKAP